MPAVYLGRLVLRWCDECNLPVLHEKCGICSSSTREVKHTPPGDVRPAFSNELEFARKIIDEHFGHGCGIKLLPPEKVVVLNKVPHVDRMDEYIVDGHVLFSIRFDPCRGFAPVLKCEGAIRLGSVITKKFVVVDAGVVNSLKGGYNVMIPGVIDADDDIKSGDEVVVLCNDRIVAVGTARVDGKSMKSGGRGIAVKIRFFCGEDKRHVLHGGQTWNDVINANKHVIDSIVSDAIAFIQDVAKRFDLPIALSYSGGKDSLATLLLMLDAGIKPTIIFADTGLEFPETLENVREVAKKYGLPLIIQDAGDGFERGLALFGPPAKNYRWCCKTCKLGPTTLLIEKYFPGGVLTFIGQRRYESEQRAKKGSVWRNPWVKKQIGVSPIQNWTAMHVWLYIFMKKAPYNKLYELGLDRIGCYLCPAADLAEFEFHKYRKYEDWVSYLREWAKKHGLGENWAECGGWRVKKEKRGDNRLRIIRASEKLDGVHGVFNKELDLQRVAVGLRIFGPVRIAQDRVMSEACTVWGNGRIVARKDTFQQSVSAVIRAMECVGCGVCVGYCPSGAIKIVENKFVVDEDKCTGCLECLKVCTVLSFR